MPSGTEDDAEDVPPGVRVALVEDDAELRRILARELRRWGYAVVELAEAATLLDLQFAKLAASGAGLADVIVSDVRMPGASGLDMLGALRCFDRRTPVILITAFGDPAVHEEGARLGARVLDKPVVIEDLVAAARDALAAARGAEEG
jgi:DNA-binding response OmpR family regulator